MRKRTFILISIILTLLTAAFCGGAATADAGNEPAARTILIWANGAKMFS